MPTTLAGACGSTASQTFTASGTAIGASRVDALNKAREQAQTLLDAYTGAFTSCPAQCPVKTVDAEPDYDGAPPHYAAVTDAPDVWSCTASVSRSVHLTCGSDGSEPVEPPPSPPSGAPSSPH